MVFGRVDEKESDSIDFTLPGEPGISKKILKGKPVKNLKIFLR